jgi:hypothetical protein
VKRRNHEPRTYLSAISLNPNSAHYYYVPADGFRASRAHSSNAFHLDDNSHSGKVSMKGRKRLEKAINWLLYLAKPKKVTDSTTGKKFIFKVNFITLTLPATQTHTDQQISATCLKNFLDVCRAQCGLNNYVWRAEAQANGNIHFHLITDVYIHHTDIRRWWNQSVELLGYIQEFQKKFHHTNPNSIDVHSVKHINRLSSYLSKYMSKERAFSCIGELRLIKGKTVEVLYGSKMYRDELANRKTGKVVGHVLGARIRLIESKLWACSRSLSAMKSINVSEDMHQFVDIHTLIQAIETRSYSGEFVQSFYGDFSPIIEKVKKQLASLAV